MKKNSGIHLLLAVCFSVPLACRAFGEIHKFTVNQPKARNFGVWRLTNDPAIRDEANYHNIQCWSPSGRYTCYTHWGGSKGPGGKSSAEVHVVDLMTGKDRLVDKGINPRWANKHNWLFYCHWTGNGAPPYKTGTQVIRYDADTSEKAAITYGMECPGGTDSTDTWLYGTQRYRGQKPEYVTVRVAIRPNGLLERIRGAPNLHAYVHVNPRHPIIMVRAKDRKHRLFGTNRAFFDLDGSNLRQGSVMAELGHMAWSGDGQYLLMGNGQARGRPWNKPFPSDIEILSWGGVGDICPCGKSGRFICGGNLMFVDTRSGDTWPVVSPYSRIIYPMAGDYSTRMDIDPKGSPDGTKIHYHSTRALENLVSARVVKYDRKHPDVIHVDSTKGFPPSGDLVAGWEVIAYAAKTPTTFERLTRRKYRTRAARDLVRKVRVLFPLSAFVLSGKDRARAQPDISILRAGFPKDYPLLYQRQTNCYIVVARRPDAPHLRPAGDAVELIPGENHWETKGYRIFRNGRPLSKLLSAGDVFMLRQPGTYTAVAIEWSGLESPASLPLQVRMPTRGKVLNDAPADFSWTREVWKVGGRPVSRAEALRAPAAVMETVHLHDGVIAREVWHRGQRASHVDFNADGKPIRFVEYENGRRKKRTYRNPDGVLASEEFFGPDGFKTEYIRYDVRPGRKGRISDHWWYNHGGPVKRVKSGKVVFDVSAAQE